MITNKNKRIGAGIMKNDMSTKIISLLFAIILWFYIIQVQSPEVERTVKDVPVLFTQKAVLEERNLMLINDKEYTVDLKLRGQRKYLMDLNKSNLSVSADVSNIDSTGSHSVYTNVVIPYGNIEIINQTPSIINVMVDEIVEEEKSVFVNTEGSPADGYKVGSIKTTPSKVKLRGAKSVVGGIDHVLATVDVSGKSEDISTVEIFELIGSSETAVVSSYVTSEQNTVDVHCEILKKKMVDIHLNFEDGLSSDERYSLDDNSVKSIEVAGAASVIDNLEKIETETIRKSMIGDDDEIEIELKLPVGVESLDGNKLTLKLKKNDR